MCVCGGGGGYKHRLDILYKDYLHVSIKTPFLVFFFEGILLLKTRTFNLKCKVSPSSKITSLSLLNRDKWERHICLLFDYNDDIFLWQQRYWNTSLYNKLVNFDFNTFSVLNSNIMFSLAYHFFVSQLIWYARSCLIYYRFSFLIKSGLLTSKVPFQSFSIENLKLSRIKFFGSYVMS